jgi:hypothetical protein
MRIKFRYDALKEGDQLEDQGVEGRISEFILRKWGLGTWIGLIWVRTGTGDGII